MAVSKVNQEEIENLNKPTTTATNLQTYHQTEVQDQKLHRIQFHKTFKEGYYKSSNYSKK